MRNLLRRLTRITSSGRFIPEIDGLRFIAIASVVCYHLVGYLAAKSDNSPPLLATPTRPMTPHLHEAHFGVQLFFVISGFILALPFASHSLKGTPRVNLKKYFLRRLTRLEPPYLLSMILLFFAIVFYKGVAFRDAAPHLGSGLFYVHNVVYGEVNPINPPAWSLEIEIQFYLLVPVLASVFLVQTRWLRRCLIVGAGGIAVLVQLLFLDASGRWGLTIINFLQLFLAGFLLADVYLADWNERPRHHWRWDLVSLIGWPLFIYIWHTSPRLSAAALPILAFCLYVATFRGVVFNRILSSLWITAIGGMCYTIYLLHSSIISFAGKLLHPVGSNLPSPIGMGVQAILLLACVLVLSTIYFVLIERPCMRRDWPRRLAAYLRGRPINGDLILRETQSVKQ